MISTSTLASLECQVTLQAFEVGEGNLAQSDEPDVGSAKLGERGCVTYVTVVKPWQKKEIMDHLQKERINTYIAGCGSHKAMHSCASWCAAA